MVTDATVFPFVPQLPLPFGEGLRRGAIDAVALHLPMYPHLDCGVMFAQEAPQGAFYEPVVGT